MAAPAMQGRFDVTVLGTPSCGGTVAAGRQGRLLVLLAIRSPQTVHDDELLRWVFADRSEPAPVSALHPLISRLRRQLRGGSPGRIDRTVHGYALAGVRTDLAAFDRLLDRALDAEAADPAIAAPLAAQALALWTGDLVEGLAGHPTVSELGQRRLLATEVRFRSELALGRHEHCTGELLRATELWPHAEEVRRLAMLALYRSGRQVDALRQYQAYRQRLVEDLGLEPGPALRRTETLVLTHSLDTPREGDGGAAGHDDRGWHGLPNYHDRFIDAPGVCAALAGAIAANRQLTVLGTAGVGKTRAVVEVVAAHPADWPAGVVFCELSKVEHGDAVAATVAATAGVRVASGAAPADALADAWGTGRRLLVLDTCEHVLAAVAVLVTDLLRRCPELHVVATSRTALHTTSERIWPMPALDDAEAAVALFVERARQADATFEPTATDGQVLASICARLDGLPLAIELAAPRVVALTPHELLAHLDDRFRLLQSGGAGRHGSLTAALDWSLRTLPTPLQRTFRALGVFVAPFDLALAGAVTGAPDIAGRLAELVAASLLVARRTAHGTRYRLLDSVRAYAREQLVATGELDGLLVRHASVVAARKDELVRAGEGERAGEAAQGLSELWPELRAAVLACEGLRRGDLLEALVVGLGAAALLQERTEVLAWAELALRRGAATASPRRAEVQAAGAVAAWTVARFDDGWAWARQAFAALDAGRTEPTADVFVAMMLLGGMADLAGFPELCARLGARAAAEGNRFAQAWMGTGETMGHAYLGRREDALAAAERAGRVERTIRNPNIEALRQFGRTIALIDDDPAAALVAADAALAAAGEAGATWIEGTTPNYRAAAMVRAGDIVHAVAEVSATLARLRRGGPVQSAANTVRNTLALLDRLGRLQRAAPLVGWLDANPVNIPGSPGMRAHVEEVRAQLAEMAEPDELAEALAAGAAMTVGEVIEHAAQALS